MPIETPEKIWLVPFELDEDGIVINWCDHDPQREGEPAVAYVRADVIEASIAGSVQVVAQEVGEKAAEVGVAAVEFLEAIAKLGLAPEKFAAQVDEIAKAELRKNTEHGGNHGA